MRMLRKAPVPQSTQSPSKRAGRASLAQRRQGRACPPAAAKPQGRRCAAGSLQSPRQPGRGQGSRRADLSTPPIPLTLRAMLGSRHPRGRSSARPAFALLSVLAVLAMALFPGLAQAEESSGIQYESEVPTVPHHESSNIPSAKPPGGSNNGGSGPGATSSNSPNGGGTGNGNSSTGGGAHSGQTNQASPGGNGNGNGGSKTAGGNVGESQQVATPGQPVSESSEGSSSPLVPILIAIAVLAAISIGAFYYRQRQQEPDSPDSSVSPKAS